MLVPRDITALGAAAAAELVVRRRKERFLESGAEIDAAEKRLRSSGLNVHWDGGSSFRFHRPTSVTGNRRDGYKQNLIGLQNGNLEVVEVLDAPMGMLSRVPSEFGGGWAFRVWDWCPGPGPGDFEKTYSSFKDAVEAVVEYYFGDPAWMCNEYAEYRRTRSCT